ncbi:hypothetical protein M9289_004634 [Salmonella enterica]|nr:hypothetical protein [Salmonella enterica]
MLTHLPGSAEPAGAVSGSRYGLMRKTRLAASVNGCAALSRRPRRSWHPGDEAAGL